MARKFHLSPRTLAIMPCSTDNCPFKTAPHFNSEDEAYDYLATVMNKKAEGPSFRVGEKKVDYLPMGMKQNENTLAVPAGIYVLCDPREIMSDDSRAWSQWIGASSISGNDRAVGASINGYPVVAINTRVEDSAFQDSLGRTVSSSSGYVGLIPVEFAQKLGYSMNDINDQGPLVNFDETGLMRWSDGRVNIGQYLTVDVEPDFVPEVGERDDFYYEMEQEYPFLHEMDFYPAHLQDDASLPREERIKRATGRMIQDMNEI